MDSISPDIAKKLLHRDLANLAQRVQRGGNLSRSERVMLQSMAVSTGQVPAVAADNSDLARILGVSRSSINRWRKLKDAPKPDASGFNNVTQWREFMRRHELRGNLLSPTMKPPCAPASCWPRWRSESCAWQSRSASM